MVSLEAVLSDEDGRKCNRIAMAKEICVGYAVARHDYNLYLQGYCAKNWRMESDVCAMLSSCVGCVLPAAIEVCRWSCPFYASTPPVPPTICC